MPKVAPHGRIDKSALAIGIRPKTGSIDKSRLIHGVVRRVEDRNWLATARHRRCDVPDCPNVGTVVGAHVRVGLEGGVGLKPSDDLVLFLCADHHDQMDGRVPALDGIVWNQRDWLVERLLKPLLRYRYRLESHMSDAEFLTAERLPPCSTAKTLAELVVLMADDDAERLRGFAHDLAVKWGLTTGTADPGRLIVLLVNAAFLIARATHRMEIFDEACAACADEEDAR